MLEWIWSIVILLLFGALYHMYRINTRFRKLGIPQPLEVSSLGFAGMNFFTREHVSDSMKKAYRIANKAKYMGCHAFFSPIVIVCDLELIKSVLVKNFDHFTNHHNIFFNDKLDPLLARNLIFANGEKWRETRNIMSPSFTLSKMRSMFILMSQCSQDFTNKLIELYSNDEAINMKDVFTRYTNDVIGTCAFGIEVNSLRDPNNEFYKIVKKITNFNNVWMMLKMVLTVLFPSLCGLIKLRIVPKEMNDFFVNLIKNTIKIREEKGIRRPDMLQLLMDARSKTSENLNMDILDITSQALVFFIGGLETTSSHMCLMAHELAVNSDIQSKLQAEIDEMMEKFQGKVTYEAINSMSYLDAVFHETLRMHPVLSMLSRVCSKQFELPPALPGAKPYLMKPGDELMIPVAAIHKDPEYFENPEIFDPDRFLEDGNFNGDAKLGFGLGPRICLGSRFALMETKVLFVNLLAKCNLRTCEKTCLPLVYDSSNFSPAARGGFWLKIEPRN